MNLEDEVEKDGANVGPTPLVLSPTILKVLDDEVEEIEVPPNVVTATKVQVDAKPKVKVMTKI